MKKEIMVTTDGSHTLVVPELNVSYHSRHGAVQESMHVFIEAGFRYLTNQSPGQPINIFEMGFGTGLNTFLSAVEAAKKRSKVYYETVEQFPLSREEINGLNYTSVLKNEDLFQEIHECNWNEETALSEYFILKKVNENLIDYLTDQRFNIIYYDAFAPNAQPELWTGEIFKKLYCMLLPAGVLVTYCSKGDVRRTMQTAGFVVEKIPGPPGKREMVRAVKVCSSKF